MQSRVRPAILTATILLLLAANLAGRPAVARAGSSVVPDGERTAIRRVIEQQMEAFRRHDAKAAFAHAAPAIQEMFGTPETFMLMVRREYPPIYQPRSFTFGELEIIGGEFTQNVTVIGEDGQRGVCALLDGAAGRRQLAHPRLHPGAAREERHLVQREGAALSLHAAEPRGASLPLAGARPRAEPCTPLSRSLAPPRATRAEPCTPLSRSLALRPRATRAEP